MPLSPQTSPYNTISSAMYVAQSRSQSVSSLFMRRRIELARSCNIQNSFLRVCWSTNRAKARKSYHMESGGKRNGESADDLRDKTDYVSKRAHPSKGMGLWIMV